MAIAADIKSKMANIKKARLRVERLELVRGSVDSINYTINVYSEDSKFPRESFTRSFAPDLKKSLIAQCYDHFKSCIKDQPANQEKSLAERRADYLAAVGAETITTVYNAEDI